MLGTMWISTSEDGISLTSTQGSTLMEIKKQVIYLNNDGQTTFTCPNCNAWWMAHREKGEVKCRACGMHKKESEYEFRVITSRR